MYSMKKEEKEKKVMYAISFEGKKDHLCFVHAQEGLVSNFI